mgnify:CR=1 FL=1
MASDEGMLMTKGQTYYVTPEDFRIMWPHTRDDFADAEIVLDYKYKEPSAATTIDGNTTIQLKDLMSWKGGQKNSMGLMFKDKEISFSLWGALLFIMYLGNTLEKDGDRIRLTQVEYSIMKVFMQNPGRALSREDILSAVWGRDFEGDLKIVDVNIRRLRIKIEDDATSPTYINTVWGFGYKWGN